MTELDTGYNTTELLDRELTEEELNMVSAGLTGGFLGAVKWFGSEEYRAGIISRARRINNSPQDNYQEIGLWD